MIIDRPRTSPRRRPATPRRGRLGSGGPRAAFLATAPAAWYDAKDLLSTTTQLLGNRLGASVLTNGTGSGSDASDMLTHPSSGYVYLPGTANNNLGVPRTGGWAATTHITATLTDASTVTYTSTADPIPLGNTSLAAGRYQRFDLRDTDANGTLRATVNLQTETTGPASWVCTTGQTITVNRSTTAYTTVIVTRPQFTATTDDYLQLPSTDIPAVTATTGTETVLVIYSMPLLQAAMMIYDTTSGAGAGGLQMYAAGTPGSVQLNAALGGVSTTVNVASSATAKDDNTVRTVGCVVNAGTIALYFDTTLGSTSSTVAVGGMTIASPRIGTRGYTVNTCYRGSIYAVVRWARALTKAELDAASTYLTGVYA